MNSSTNQPERQRLDSLANSEPKHTVAQETNTDADWKHDPRGELVARDAGRNADVFADVVGDAEYG